MELLLQGLSQGRVHSSVAQVLLHLHWPSTQQLLQAALVAQLCLPLHFHRFHHQACCQRARPGRCPPAGSRSAAAAQDGLRYQYRSSPSGPTGCRNPSHRRSRPAKQRTRSAKHSKFFSSKTKRGYTAGAMSMPKGALCAQLGRKGLRTLKSLEIDLCTTGTRDGVNLTSTSHGKQPFQIARSSMIYVNGPCSIAPC